MMVYYSIVLVFIKLIYKVLQNKEVREGYSPTGKPGNDIMDMQIRLQTTIIFA